MSSPRVLVRESRRGSPAVLPPATLHAVARVLVAVGLVLAVAGLVDVGLFYWPMRFGDAEWEFGTIAQTFDALPLPTLGLALVAVGLWARGGRPAWMRGMAAVFAIAAAIAVFLGLIFLLDVPVALKALSRAAATAQQRGVPPNPLVSSGLKRGIGKAVIFAVAYAAGYATISVTLWRGVRRSLRAAAAG